MHDLSKKKILLTGGHGFLGKHIVATLKNHGVPEGNIFTPSSEEFDLRILGNAQKAVAGCDLVIHAAAKVGGIGYNRDHSGEIFYDNILMGTNMIEAARLAKTEKFVAVSTICAYPKFTPVPFKEEDLWNGYPEETNAPYGLAKKMMLVQEQAYRTQYGLNGIYLLLLNLYGPGDNFDLASSHVIPALIRKVYEAKRDQKPFIEVWGTGKATRGFLYVEDAAEGIVLATEKYEKADPVNIGTPSETSIQDLAETICRLMNYGGDLRWNDSKPDGQPRRSLDVSRAKREFGFEAKTSFEEGLKKTIDWYIKEEQR